MPSPSFAPARARKPNLLVMPHVFSLCSAPSWWGDRDLWHFTEHQVTFSEKPAGVFGNRAQKNQF